MKFGYAFNYAAQVLNLLLLNEKPYIKLKCSVKSLIN